MKRICSAFLSTLIFIFMLSMSVTAQNENDLLAAYQAVLNQFNEQYGMSARFPTESELSKIGRTIQDRNDFITSMTTDEYFDHLVDTCLDTDEIESENESEISSNVQNTSEPGMTRDIQQKYVYGNDNGNFLYILVTRYYVNGTCYYGSYNGAGSAYGGSYPYYDYVSSDHVFESNYTKVWVSFHCNKCWSLGVTEQGFLVSCKFRATDNTIYDPQLNI